MVIIREIVEQSTNSICKMNHLLDLLLTNKKILRPLLCRVVCLPEGNGHRDCQE